MNLIKELIAKHGSDKNEPGYTDVYSYLFEADRQSVRSVLEVGIGTLDATKESSFIGNLSISPSYKPGGSLRAWAEYFPHAQIRGMDIAQDCMFTQDRIQTYLCDSTKYESACKALRGEMFDIIIDDGLHTALGQLATLLNLFERVVYNGWYIIEDCGGSGDGDNVYNHLAKAEFLKDHSYYFVRPNMLVIRKDFSKRGEIFNMSETDLTLVAIIADDNISSFENFMQMKGRMQRAPWIIYAPPHLEKRVWRSRLTFNTAVIPWDKTTLLKFAAPFVEFVHTEMRLQRITAFSMLHDVAVWNSFGTNYLVYIDVKFETLKDQNVFVTVSKHLDGFESFNSFATEFTHKYDYIFTSADIVKKRHGDYYGAISNAVRENDNVDVEKVLNDNVR